MDRIKELIKQQDSRDIFCISMLRRLLHKHAEKRNYSNADLQLRIGIDEKGIRNFRSLGLGGPTILDSISWYLLQDSEPKPESNHTGKKTGYYKWLTKNKDYKGQNWQEFRNLCLQKLTKDILSQEGLYLNIENREELPEALYIGLGIDEASSGAANTLYFISSYQLTKNKLIIQWMSRDGKKVKTNEADAWKAGKTLFAFCDEEGFRMTAMANIGDIEAPDKLVFTYSLIVEGTLNEPYVSVAFCIKVKEKGQLLKPKRKLVSYDLDNLKYERKSHGVIPTQLFNQIKEIEVILHHKGLPIHSDSPVGELTSSIWIGHAKDLEVKNLDPNHEQNQLHTYTLTFSLQQIGDYSYVLGFMSSEKKEIWEKDKLRSVITTWKLKGEAQIKNDLIRIQSLVYSPAKDQNEVHQLISDFSLNTVEGTKQSSQGNYSLRREIYSGNDLDRSSKTSFGEIEISREKASHLDQNIIDLHSIRLAEKFRESGISQEQFQKSLMANQFTIVI